MSAELDEFLRRRELGQQARVATAIKGAPKMAPQQATDIDTLAKTFGVPAEVVKVNPDLFNAERAANEATQITRGSPRLGAWLTQNELNHAKAADSLPELSIVEQVLKKPLMFDDRNLRERAADFLSGKGWKPNKITPADDWRNLKQLFSNAKEIAQNTPPSYFARNLGAGALDLASNAFSLGEISTEGFGSMPSGLLNPGGLIYDAVHAARKSAAAGANEIAAPPTGNTLVDDALVGVRSIPYSALGVGLGAATGGATVPALALGGLTGAGSFSNARDKGASYERSLAYGTIDALAEAGFERISLGKLFGEAGSSFSKRLIENLVTEVGTEEATTLVQNFNQFALIDQPAGKTWDQFVSEIPASLRQTFIATLVGTGTINTALHVANKMSNRVEQRFQRVQNAERAAAMNGQLQTLAKNAKIASRDPASFADFVKHAAEDTDVQDVYIKADTLVDVLEQSGLTTEQVSERLPSVAAQLGEALSSGGDVRIPIEELSTAQDVGDLLTDHIRIDPNDPSKAEATVYLQSAKEEIAAETQAMFDKASEDSTFRAEVDQIRDRVASELGTANRFTPEVNSAYAALYGNFFGRLAQDMGVSPLAVADRYGLKVQSTTTTDGRVLDQALYDPPRQAARLFSPEGIHTLPTTRNWTILTAANPNAKALSDKKNAERNQKLKADLDALGVDYVETIGKYGNVEPGFAITGMDTETAIALGEKYGQESVLTRHGNVNVATRMVDPSTGVIEVYDETNTPEDYYTEIPSLGVRFTMGLTFGAQVPLDNTEELASWTPDRIGTLLDMFAYFDDRNKSKAHAVRMSPAQFLGLTLSAKGRDVIKEHTGPLNAEKMRGEIQPIFLTLSYTPARTTQFKGNITYIPEEFRVMGHEGRHRMTALQAAGVESVPVVLRIHNAGKPHETWEGNGAPIAELALSPQRASRNSQLEIGDTPTKVFGTEPISYVNRATLLKRFGNDKAMVLFQEAEDIFYSSLLRTVETSKQGKATPAEWKGILQNAPGVKTEEIFWSGVFDLLEMRQERDGPKAQITREELASLLQSRGIVLKEVVLGGQFQEPDDYEIDERVYENRREAERDFKPEDHGLVGAVEREVIGAHPDLFNLPGMGEAADVINNRGESPIYGTNYYALDAQGGRLADEDGNEVFATREEAEDVVEAWQIEATEKYWEQWEEDERDHVRDDLMEYYRGEAREQDGAAQFAGYSTDPDNESYRELLLTLPPGEGHNPKRTATSHWDEDGVVTHIRFMEKHHADGKPILFIEEIQSDWHQKGRDEGYEQPVDPAKIEAAQKAFDEAQAKAFAAADKMYAFVKENFPEAEGLSTAPYTAAMLSLESAAKSADAHFKSITGEFVAGVATERQMIDAAKARAKAWARYSALSASASVKAKAITSQRDAQFLADATTAEEAGHAEKVADITGDPVLELAKVQAEYSNLVQEAGLLGRELDVAKGLITNGGVPNAPFKTTYPELAMKRAIRWAVDNGYTRIAWINGSQQNGGRTGQALGGEITVEPQADGRVRFGFPEARENIAQAIIQGGHGEFVSGYSTVDMTREQAKTVLGQFGADAFDRGLNGPDVINADAQMFSQGGWFYDRNLPNIVNGLIKKRGGKVAPMPVREFGGTTPEKEAEELVARITGDMALGVKTGATRQDVIEEIDRKLAENTPEALAEKWAQYRAKLVDNIEKLRAVIEDTNHPDRMDGAVPAYMDALKIREEELSKFDNADGSREEERRQKLVDWLQNARKSLVDLAEGKLPPGKDTHLGFEITDKLAEVAAGGFPLFQKTGAARGQIAFAEDITQAPSVITLLRGADLSTFLHETGHFFLQVMVDVAQRPDAPARVVQDLDTFFNHVGVRGLTEWSQMGPSEQREHHETFARSFEAYLFAGKAPSLELRSLFGRFRSWLISVYKDITRLNVTMTPEVTGVFSRMIATDAEIEEAENDFGFTPALSEKPPHLTDAEWAEYQSLGADATREAESTLDRRSLNDMRYGRNALGKELKKRQREVAALRKLMRQEVAADVAAEPVYRAIEFMRKGTLNGEAVEGPTKLNSDALTEDQRTRLRGMTAKDGLDPANVAELFGFSSADHFIQTLTLTPKLSEAIEIETEQRLLERYGDITSDKAMQDAAVSAVHNDVRGRFIATQMRAVAQTKGNTRALAAAAKRMAEDVVSRLKVRHVRPAQFEAAERRAEKAAREAIAANDTAKAGVETRNQLVNFYGAKVAQNTLDEIRKALTYLRKFENAGTRKNIDVDYIEQIDALLERFDLRVSTTGKQIERRRSLVQWVERMRDNGFEPVISEDLLDEARRTSYKELTVEEMRGLVDAVRNIEHLGRLKKTLLTAKKNRDFAAAVDEVATTVEENAYRTVDIPLGSRTWLERVKEGFADFFAAHKKIANMTHIMDGNKYGGNVWEYFMRPLNEAGDREASMTQDAMKKLHDIFSILKGDNLTSKTFEPAIGRSISLQDRLAVALNWGNESNRQRIIDGDRWTEAQVQAILAPLTEKHAKFVQDIWDYFDSFWPEIAAKERRVTGVTPEKVEAIPFDLNGYPMRGGYYRIKYDPARNSKAEGDTAAEVLAQMQRGAHTSATTRRGHTKARAENVDRPLRKDLGVIFQHVNEVIHDLTHHEALIDVNRMLRAGPVDAAIRSGYGPETLRWMRKAFEDIAMGDIPAQNAVEASINYLRTGATVAGLGLNLWTSLLQPIGLTQSMSRIGTKWVGRGIAELFKDPAKMNAKLDWIYENSSFMQQRANTMQREINEIRNQITDKSPLRKTIERAVPGDMIDAVTGSYFYFIAKAQLIADVPTWLGQYEKSMAGGEEHDRAVMLANQAVIDSQGGGQIKDLAGVQRGGVWQKLFTNFYSYFSATFNLMADRTAELRRVGASDLPYFAIDFALLSIVPATLTSLLHYALKGGSGDDDDLWSLVAKDNLSYMTGTMIGLREIGAIGLDRADYTGPAGARIFSEMTKFGKQVKQGEVDEALLRAGNNLLGILLHYPAGQVDRTVRGTTAYLNGEAGPQAPLVGPPPK